MDRGRRSRDMRIYLHPTHPYVRTFTSALFKLANGYRVKWRQFDTQKTDAEFARFSDAERQRRLLSENCHVIETDIYEDWDGTFRELTDWWAKVLDNGKG